MSNSKYPPKVPDMEELKRIMVDPIQSADFRLLEMGPGRIERDLKPEPYVKKDQAIKDLTERVEALERLIKVTFNGHVLINGQFVKIVP